MPHRDPFTGQRTDVDLPHSSTGMIVACATCGPLPSADLEELGAEAWEKHVAEHHPKWRHSDGSEAP